METSSQKKLDSIRIRLVLLWALVEISLGGFLHALRLPLSGLMVGSIAILALYLIARQSETYREVMVAFVMVASLKFAFSPQSSPFSYIAMFMQTMCVLPLTGASKRPTNVTISILLIIASLYSPFQKLIILWFTLGNDVIIGILDWLQQVIPFTQSHSLIWWYPIFFWVFIHFIAGLMISLLAIRWRTGLTLEQNLEEKWNTFRELDQMSRLKEKHQIAPKSTFLFLSLMIAILIVLMVVYRETWIDHIIRPLVIITVWFIVLRPAITWWGSSRHLNEEDLFLQRRVSELIPTFRRGVLFSWIEAKQGSWIHFPSRFITVFFTWGMYLSWEK
jgi:hypothetical protein